LRITNPDEIEQVFFGNAASVRSLRRDRNEQVQREENQATYVTWQHSLVLPLLGELARFFCIVTAPG
jgi:hypothetical protein